VRTVIDRLIGLVTSRWGAPGIFFIGLGVFALPYPNLGNWKGADNLEWSGPLLIAIGFAWLGAAALYYRLRPRPGARSRRQRRFARWLRRRSERSRLWRLIVWLHRKLNRPNYAGGGDEP
jgi:hypothetical protein